MATVTKPSVPVTNHDPNRDLQDAKQLHHDRIVGVVMLVVLFLVFALMIWLASLGNGGGEIESFDYWSVPF